MIIDEKIKEEEECWPDVEKLICQNIIVHISHQLREAGELEVLRNPMWISRTLPDTKDEPVNEQAYLYGDDYPNGLSKYVCERSHYKGEILEFLLEGKVGFPYWLHNYTHLLEEEDYKYIFQQLKKIGEQIKCT
jgi:hypothetical protein